MTMRVSFFEPHREAAAFIRGKPALAREVFDQLLPELRARAFTVTGIEAANILENLRDQIAALPEGKPWDEVKSGLIEGLSPFLGEAAERRAELLLRIHGFQAFQAATWRAAQLDEDTTHLQYLTMEDERVRPSHQALDGVVLPKDDPFWETHTPPWDWGCRCRIRPLNPDQVALIREQDRNKPPEAQRIIEGPALEQLRHGRRITPDGQAVDVTPPGQKAGAENAFTWDPRSLMLPLDQLKARYAPAIWAVFEQFARQQQIGTRSLWDWLASPPLPFTRPRQPPTTKGQTPARKPIEQLKRQLLQAGFSQRIAQELDLYPDAVARHFATLKIAASNRTRLAFYRPRTKTIHMGTDPTKWNGRPAVLAHEFGHHLHYETNTISAASIRAEFKTALAEDLQSLQAFEASNPGIFNPTRCTAFALNQYGAASLSAVQDQVSRLADSLGAISKGQWGWGHSRSYYRSGNNWAMEIFAHAVSAIIYNDTVFKRWFPKTWAAVAQILQITK